MTERTTDVIIFLSQNSTADAVQAPAGTFSANNYSREPQVEDLSRIISGGQEVAQEHESTSQRGSFGTNLKEAVAIVKDWVHNP